MERMKIPQPSLYERTSANSHGIYSNQNYLIHIPHSNGSLFKLSFRGFKLWYGTNRLERKKMWTFCFGFQYEMGYFPVFL